MDVDICNPIPADDKRDDPSSPEFVPLNARDEMEKARWWAARARKKSAFSTEFDAPRKP